MRPILPFLPSLLTFLLFSLSYTHMLAESPYSVSRGQPFEATQAVTLVSNGSQPVTTHLPWKNSPEHLSRRMDPAPDPGQSTQEVFTVICCSVLHLLPLDRSQMLTLRYYCRWKFMGPVFCMKLMRINHRVNGSNILRIL